MKSRKSKFSKWRSRLDGRAKRSRGGMPSNEPRVSRRPLFELLETRALLTTIDLATLGIAGTTIFGVDANDNSGWAVGRPGDVNGDGFDDLLISAIRAGAAGNSKPNAGEVTLIFGKADWSATPTIDLANLGSEGVTVYGADASDLIGFSLGGPIDVNGDGFHDLMFGSIFGDALGNAKPQAGESHVVFGKPDWSNTPTIDLTNLGTNGITFFGAEVNDRSGISISSPGDVNGDGFDEVLISAYQADGADNSKSSAGDHYLIFGKSDWTTTPTIDLGNLSYAGITLYGVDAGDRSGISVSGAGDVNGDGFDDLLIGAFRSDSSGNTVVDAGETYLIFGKANWSTAVSIDLSDIGPTGITLFGAEVLDQSGYSVSRAGDANGDGFDDLLIGAPTGDALGNAKPSAGESYLIFGKADWSATPTIDLANLGSAGLVIFGADVNDTSGISVSSAGDVNGDGYDDLLIGARQGSGPGNTRLNAGESYVIFGKASWSTTPTIDLANLGSAGITLFGADAGDYSGWRVSGAGDVNGDGFDDFLIGASEADAAENLKSNAGESYLIFGGNQFTSSIPPANLGNSAANTIIGNPSANILNGAGGKDTLIGNGGADVLLGGQGDDILAVSGSNFRRIVGGTGYDTLRLDGSGTFLDLTLIPDNRIVDIESINLTGSGDNTLRLNQREVLNLSSSTNTLVVRGNSGDRVFFEPGWIQGALEDISGESFQIYYQGAAILKVQTGVSVSTQIDLANLGLAGVTIFGADAQDYSGTSVSSAGDVNGDGFDDFLIGANSADGAGNAKLSAGESYLIFGKADWSTTPTLDLANLGSAGITFLGADAADGTGQSVSSAGDVNGDGYDDLLIGAFLADASGNSTTDAGETYLIFGKADWSATPTIDLGNLGTLGVTIFGVDLVDRSGWSVSSAGDVNGDGFDDLLIGARDADSIGNAKSSASESYLIFGKSNWSATSTMDLNNLGTAGVTIFGVDTNDRSGWSVSSAGDVNGDGFDDLLIGADGGDGLGNAKPNSGESYLIFGKPNWSATPTIDLANLGAAGITIFGADATDNSGGSVSRAGDVNGDGFDDLLISARLADGVDNAKSNAGETYLLFGKADWSSTQTIDLANFGTAGITIIGSDVGDYSGWSVSSAGDFNGDGFDDLLIGALGGDASSNLKSLAGDSYVIFGKADWSTTPTIDLANLNTAGIVIYGADAGDNSGTSVRSAGDVNGDGFEDLLIGASRAAAFGNLKLLAGESTIIFGSNNFTNSILPANLGDASDNTIIGTAEADILSGGAGDDILIGNGEADVLLGGQGDDILAVRNLSFMRIVGGSGIDTLRLDGSGLFLDLTAIPDNRMVDVEVIDLTGSGDNSLLVTPREVLNISSSSNTLTILGNAGDRVAIGLGWAQQADQGGFKVFTRAAATLKISRNITILISYASVSNRYVYHAGSTFASGGVTSALDLGKTLAKEGQGVQQLNYNNLINSSRGINGLVFDIANMPGTLTAADFRFQMSPTGAFNEMFSPPILWANAPAPANISVTAGSPSRVTIQWPDNAIANRWLRVTLKANLNTGLAQPEVYYLGHLLGETTGPVGGVYTVAFADITPIRSSVGQSVNASNIHDIDKNGTVAFADISAMRSNVGAQLRNITIGVFAGNGLGDELGSSTSDGEHWFGVDWGVDSVKAEFSSRRAAYESDPLSRTIGNKEQRSLVAEVAHAPRRQKFDSWAPSNVLDAAIEQLATEDQLDSLDRCNEQIRENLLHAARWFAGREKRP